MDALIALVRKDLVLYFSNRRALLVTLAAPILIAAFFGSVMGGGTPTKPSRVPVAVVDLDGSAVSKDVVAAMKADSAFDLQETGEAEAVRLVREGKVRAAVVLPAGFGDDAPRALFSPGEEARDRGALRPVAGDGAPAREGAARAARDAGARRDASAAPLARRPVRRLAPDFSLPFTTQAVESTARRRAVQRLRALLRRHGRAVHPLHGHRARRRACC